MSRKAKILTLVFASMGSCVALLCAVCAFAIPTPWNGVDDLLLILCPHLWARWRIYDSREGVVIWLEIVAANTFLYTVVGAFIGIFVCMNGLAPD